MSSDELSARQAPPIGGNATLIQYDEYINTKVESTRRLVKIVDLSTSLVVLAAGVLAYLLVAAVVEHWLVPGGYSFAARLVLFAILVSGVAYFAYRQLWPLLARRVNPVYAAHTIETSAATGPSLKNSLVNLLLFRQKRAEISDAVYQTLEEQAAQRLSRISVDAAVDRSLLIRFGYVTLAIVAAAAAYKMFSPKDPVVSARRVLIPWADVAPASRVSISDIRPGAVTLSRGEHLDVSADVRGISDTDSVLLRFKTDDRQAVDKSVVMKPSADGLRFEGRLPDATGAASQVGLAQSLRYRIEAGDARSLEYNVHVIPAPSMIVERVEYDYPDYTGYVDRHVDGFGDIRAIEGTRVTITARANGPIKAAHVDFDADGRNDLDMTANEQVARTSFQLALREDRQTPKHASYVLRFTNDEGRTNRNPVKHSIGVEPDIGPEAAIRLPQEQSLAVRLDETVAIEVDARDPDFALADVRLHGKVGQRAVLGEPLLTGRHAGRFTARYSFTASEHELKVGDVVEYWVTANDNRTPQPNSTATEPRQLRIVSPDPAQPPPDRLAQRDPQQRQQQGEQQQGDAGGQGEQQAEQQPGTSDGQGQPGQQGQQGDRQQSQHGDAQGQQGGEQQFGSDAQQSAQQQQGQGDKGNVRQGESNQQGSESNQPQAGEQSGGENQPGAQGQQSNQQRQPGEENSNNKQTGAGAAGGESSQGSQPAGTRQPDSPAAGSARPDGNSSERQNGDTPQQGERQNGTPHSGEQQEEQADPSPVSSEGDNDAEAFERIRRHMEQSGELKEGESDPSQSEFSRDAQRSADGKEGQGNKETGRHGESQAGNDKVGQDSESKAGENQQSGQKPDAQQEQNKSVDGQPTTTKGPEGAGDEQQPQGSPNARPDMKPTEKHERSASQDQQSNNEEPPAGARGKRESDSQGEQGGDKSGGGEEGAGQKAPRDGTGSAGQNQSADDGAGESSEQGVGNDSQSAGRETLSNDQTGQTSGETPGGGSKTRADQGDDPQGKQRQGDKETGRRREQDANAKQVPIPSGDEPLSRDEGATEHGQRSEDSDATAQDGTENAIRGGTPTGRGGETGSTNVRPPSVDSSAPDGDEANLEYARKQTDLVLEKLADQLNREEVDERLLDQLGWSEDDLRKFVDRWRSRKQAAAKNDPNGEAAKRELDEALRSLGLRRGAMRQGPVNDDALRDLREGYRGAVPLEYRERLRAYNQGVSRSRQDDQ